ncbi:MAG TPA: methylated-DNA--[protein]-cysteine S-methyltransferase [Acidimicrobiia bacterium]|nr:methylated-DNA--[protein]-cysteine S-methyltransferase [Acidimicrobiia bacterium]
MTSPETYLEASLGKLRTAAPSQLLTGIELGTGLMDGYARYETVLGEVSVTFNVRGVSSVDLTIGDFEGRFRSRFGRPLTNARPPSAWQKAIGRALEVGRPGALPIDFGALTGFQREVLEMATTIPRGQVRPYSWLARQTGRSGAARAVGSTMARNPVPLIVPCHRVVRSDGRIGEYSLGGASNKWSLLESEGAGPSELEEMAAAGVRYLGSDSTGIFCHPTCNNARRITPTHLRRFRTKGSAASNGFRPCLVCQP